jgi:hypothetical protein
MESETLRETQRMGDLAVRPLTFKPYSNSQHKSVNHEDSSSPQGLGCVEQESLIKRRRNVSARNGIVSWNEDFCKRERRREIW